MIHSLVLFLDTKSAPEHTTDAHPAIHSNAPDMDAVIVAPAVDAAPCTDFPPETDYEIVTPAVEAVHFETGAVLFAPSADVTDPVNPISMRSQPTRRFPRHETLKRKNALIKTFRITISRLRAQLVSAKKKLADIMEEENISTAAQEFTETLTIIQKDAANADTGGSLLMDQVTT